MKLPRSSFSNQRLGTATLFLLITSLSLFGQVSVLTQHNDTERTGANLNETILNTANVNVNGFGKLFTNGVDGQVYAQPLYVSNVSIGGGTHNVVYVATENNSVYAFDADSAGVTYWHKNFGTPFSPSCSDLTPVVGITGTPVIDLSTNTLYVDAKLASGPTHELHALSTLDGSEKFGGPVTISAGNFNASIQHQRPGLLLANGEVYLAFGSHCDGGSYHGFLMGFDAGTLTHLHTLDTTSSGSQGSIWQSGMGPAADSSGNIYFITGNGDRNGSSNLGESYVKVSGSLSLLDSFTPSNWMNLNSGDTDLGAGGPVLIPSHFIVGIGKDGELHLVDQNSMGGLGGGLQSFSAASGANTTGMSPVYWQGPSKQYIFLSHGNSPTKSFEFTGSSINTTPLGTNSVTQADRPGGTSLSANGVNDGILWLIGSDSKMRAYDAVNFPIELWDSGQNSSRDSMGTYVKFVAPTIANGKVYVATHNSLVVYGLLSCGVPPAPANLTATAGNAQVSLSWNAASCATSYNVKRATVSGGPYTTVGSPTSTSFTDTGLTNGTTYFYVVTAVDSAGESGNSNQANATPQSGGGTANAISINFVGNGVTPMGSSESAGVVAKTNWNNATGPSGSGQALNDETGASTSATLSWAGDHLSASGITDTAGNNRMMKGAVNTSNTSTSTVTVSGLTSHSYDVYLYFNENTFGATRTAAYTISGTGITTTTINGTDNAQFSGTFTQANNSVGNYVKFSITATGFTVTAKPVSSSDANLRAPVNGIQIIPTSGGGPPPAPTNLTATAGNAQVSLSWTASSGATGYNVKRGTVSGGPYTTVGSPTSTSFTDTGLTNGTTYFYVVTAVNANGESSNSNQASATPSGSPPPAPTNLAATAGNAQVSLSWTASSGATSYNVKRGTVSGGPYTTVGSPTSTSFTDTGLTNGTTYFYVVTAVNTNGESGNSNEASSTPTASTVNAISINIVGKGVTPMGSSESAGVVAKTNWNNATGPSGSGQVLNDETGASTSATLTWAGDHLSASGITDTAGNNRMMKGAVNTSNTSTTTVTVSGLTSHTYDVYFYFNENTFGATRTAAYTISGTGITTTTIDGTYTAQFNGTFTQANNSVGNYVKFTITATGFTVTAAPVSSTDTHLRAPVNGIQIIPGP